MAEDKGFKQWWREARPTKTATFWSWVLSVVLTMIVGFAWGGWVTGGTAREMAKELAEEAVAKRLAPICVLEFHKDAEKDKKLKALKEMSSYQRGDYVKRQGWAKIPGEKEADDKVAEECARVLVLISP